MSREQRFQAAEQVLDDYLGHDLKNLEAALDTLDPSEHDAFLAWSHDKHERDCKAIVAAERSLPRLSAVQLLTSLHRLGLDDPTSTSNFYDLINGPLHAPRPERVPLGAQDGIHYFILPGTSAVWSEQYSNWEDLKFHPTFSRFKSNVGARPLLDFDFHVGPLRWASSAEPRAGEFQHTPVQVFLNPVSSKTAESFSLWLVLDRECEGDELDCKADTWSWMSPTRGILPAFDCMQLFTAEEVRLATLVPSSDGFRGVKSGDISDRTALTTARMHCLVPWPALSDEVIKAKEASSSSGSQSDPTRPAHSAFLAFDDSPGPST